LSVEGLTKMVADNEPHKVSLQKSVAAPMKAAGEGAVSAVSATSPKNDSTLKQMSSVCPGGTPGMKVQGSASSGPLPYDSASGWALVNASRRVRAPG